MVAEISRVKDIDEHIPIKMHWSLFLYFRGIGTSFELLTATIGPRASLMRCLDDSIEMK